jgi:hypothetical protein
MKNQLFEIAKDAGLPISWWEKAIENGETREWREITRFAELVLQKFGNMPKHHGSWIVEYPGDVFVVFDPTTDGAGILGASRNISGANKILSEAG